MGQLRKMACHSQRMRDSSGYMFETGAFPERNRTCERQMKASHVDRGEYHFLTSSLPRYGPALALACQCFHRALGFAVREGWCPVADVEGDQRKWRKD